MHYHCVSLQAALSCILKKHLQITQKDGNRDEMLDKYMLIEIQARSKITYLLPELHKLDYIKPMKSEEPVIDPREVKKEPIKNVLDEEKMIAPQEAEEPNRMIAPQKAEEPRQYIDNINAFFAKICSESNIYDTIREVFE